MGRPQLLQPQPPNVISGNNIQMGQMPCKVPDTSGRSTIPNALPQLIIPTVAAIPNAGLEMQIRVEKMPLSLPKEK